MLSSQTLGKSTQISIVQCKSDFSILILNELEISEPKWVNSKTILKLIGSFGLYPWYNFRSLSSQMVYRIQNE